MPALLVFVVAISFLSQGQAKGYRGSQQSYKYKGGSKEGSKEAPGILTSETVCTIGEDCEEDEPEIQFESESGRKQKLHRSSRFKSENHVKDSRPYDVQCRESETTPKVDCKYTCAPIGQCMVRALTTCHCKSSWGSGTWPCFRGSATGPVTGKHSKSIPEKCKRNGCTNCVKSKHPLHKACSLEGGHVKVTCDYRCFMGNCQVHARTDCEYDVHGAQMRYSSMWRGPVDSDDQNLPPKCKKKSGCPSCGIGHD